MRRILARSALVGAATGTLITAVPALAAHNWSGRHWHTGPIKVYDGLNTNDGLKDRLYDSTSGTPYSWNAYTDTPFAYSGTNGSSTNLDKTVYYSSIDGKYNILGVTTTSTTASDPHVIVAARTRMDNAEPWYWGTGDASGSSVDGWSVVAHEIGHWIHLGDLGNTSSTCPDNSSRPTMCNYVGGTERQRTPNTAEDIDSANKAY